MRTKLLAAALIASAFSAHADTKLHLGGWSWHYAGDYITNENHQAVLIEHNGVIGGTMLNSYGRRSWTLGYKADLISAYGVDMPMTIGALTGYRKDETFWPVVGGVTPMLSISVEPEHFVIMPTLHVMGSAFILMATVNF